LFSFFSRKLDKINILLENYREFHGCVEKLTLLKFAYAGLVSGCMGPIFTNPTAALRVVFASKVIKKTQKCCI